MEGDVSLSLGEAELTLLGSGAVYWEAEAALFVADLHLGKAETFQRYGLALPSGHSLADLDRLVAVAKAQQARQVYILGDLIHARAGLTHQHVAAVADWLLRTDLDIAVVLGNHDQYAGGVPAVWGLTTVAEGYELAGLTLNHHPTDGDAPRLCGHVHPVVNLGSRADRLRLPCFVLEQNQLMLPAFGSVTGGASVRPGPSRDIYAAAGEGVVQVPGHLERS